MNKAWTMVWMAGLTTGWISAIGAQTALARTAPSPALPERIANSQTAFALDLYAHLRTDEGNLFFSPYSIASALAMTYGGARGETAAQMARMLRFPADATDIHPAHAKLAARLRHAQRDGKVALHVANALWPQKDYAFRKEYLNLLKKHYDAPATAVDYRTAPEAARQTINAWVEKQTRERIKDLFAPGTIVPLTRMVLANAIWFKGDWAHPFDAKRTEKAPFSVSATKRVSVPMMRQTTRFPYAEFKELQIMEMPYAGGDLSMLIVLPATGLSLNAVEDSLDLDTLEKWTSALRSREVETHVPKFKMVWGARSLVKELKAMGMTDAFQAGGSDFSGMDGSRELFMDVVMHKAFVEVNEEGTEAAAATGIGMRATSIPAPPPVFKADRPFLFLIREKNVGLPLFMGRVANPTE